MSKTFLTQTIDVVIRAHLEAPYLKEAIESVLNQKYVESIVIHVVLDRPSKWIIEYLNDVETRFEIIVSESSHGNLSASMNIGLENSFGEYFSVLDGDDLMTPTRLYEQVKFLEKNKAVAVVGSDFLQIDSKGRELKYIKMHSRIKKNTGTHWESSPVAHSSVMIRRRVLNEVGCYRNFFQFAEDFDLWLRINQKYEIANIPIALTKYRIHDSQTTIRSFSRLAWVQVASRVALKNRLLDQIEINERFTSLEEWKRRARFSAPTLYKVLYELILHEINRLINQNKRIQARVLSMFKAILYPQSVIPKYLEKGRSSKART